MTKARDLASGAPAPAGVTSTELGYVDGVTSAIQTQITNTLAVANAKTTIAQGTNAARPTGSQGDLYYDTTFDSLYQKTATSWVRAGSGTPVTLEALVIAGGGGGGAWISGGGGAGGIAYHSSRGVAPDIAYTVTVGAGGAGAQNSANDSLGDPFHVGANGGDSYFDVIRAFGGGGGGGNGSTGPAWNGKNGGSGGGAQQGRSAGTATQTSNNGATGYGNNGGAAGSFSNWTGSGGGGAGAVGGAISGSNGGAGGAGLSTWSTWGNAVSLGQNISGTRWFGGGGGGSGTGSNGAGGNGGGGAGGNGSAVVSGLANTGGGGGGQVDAATSGGNGGSGAVIIRYADTAPPLTTVTSGLTYTTVVTGGYRYYAFTAGTGTVTW
jgi:hypothetical protein